MDDLPRSERSSQALLLPDSDESLTNSPPQSTEATPITPSKECTKPSAKYKTLLQESSDMEIMYQIPGLENENRNGEEEEMTPDQREGMKSVEEAGGKDGSRKMLKEKGDDAENRSEGNGAGAKNGMTREE